jgi:hypothetical protein
MTIEDLFLIENNSAVQDDLMKALVIHLPHPDKTNRLHWEVEHEQSIYPFLKTNLETHPGLYASGYLSKGNSYWDLCRVEAADYCGPWDWYVLFSVASISIEAWIAA